VGLPIVAGLSASAADSHDPEALAIWRRAVEIHSKDYERLRECTLAGEMRVSLGKPAKTARSQVTIQLKENQFWMKLSVQEQDPKDLFLFTEKQIVCDGKTITEARFSDRIRPTGCTIELHTDDFSDFGITTGSRIDVRKDLVTNWFREDYSDKFASRGALLNMEIIDGRPVIILSEMGFEQKFWFDPAWGDRLIRLESASTPSKPPSYIYEYTYAKESGLVRPKLILMKHRFAGNNEIYQLDVSSVVPGVKIKAFDSSALVDVPPGTRTHDHRGPKKAVPAN
jgi:hypothetical protein